MRSLYCLGESFHQGKVYSNAFNNQEGIPATQLSEISFPETKIIQMGQRPEHSRDILIPPCMFQPFSRSCHFPYLHLSRLSCVVFSTQWLWVKVFLSWSSNKPKRDPPVSPPQLLKDLALGSRYWDPTSLWGGESRYWLAINMNSKGEADLCSVKPLRFGDECVATAQNFADHN